MRFRRLLAPLLAAALVSAGTIFLAPPANAAPNATMNGNGRLTITADPAGGFLIVECAGGKVTINSMATAFDCAAVKKIVINGSNKGDTIDVSAVDGGSFAMNPEIEIFGKGQSDIFILGFSIETVSGGAGLDVVDVYPSVGPLTITNTKLASGGGEVDSISSIGHVSARLDDGSNTVDASAFSGTLFVLGGTGADAITGTKNADILFGEAGADQLIGLGGADQLEGGVDNDSINGGGGTDLALFTDLDANISVTNAFANSAATGNDTLQALEQIIVTQLATPGLNNVDLSGFPGEAAWVGSDQGDTVKGSQGGTSFSPKGGNDTITGNGGGSPDSDSMTMSIAGSATFGATASTSTAGVDLYTGVGRLTVNGSAGADLVNATAFTGSTTMALGNGADTGLGGPGDDVFIIGTGDSFDGNAGTDLLLGGAFPEQVLSDANFTATGVASSITEIERANLTAAEGSSIDASAFSGRTTLTGDNGNETLTGGADRDTIMGDDGNDRLKGLGGNDAIFGQNGNDRLIGGTGKDRCIGGPGSDRLRFCEQGRP